MVSLTNAELSKLLLLVACDQSYFTAARDKVLDKALAALPDRRDKPVTPRVKVINLCSREG